MSQNNKISLLLQAKDMFSKTFQDLGKADKKFKAQNEKNRKEFKKYDDLLKKSAGQKKMVRGLRESTLALGRAKQAQKKLAEEIRNTVNPTQTLLNKFDAAKQKVRRLSGAFEVSKGKLHNLQSAFEKAGIKSGTFANKQGQIKAKIDRLNPALKRQNDLLQKQYALKDRLNKHSMRRDAALQRGANMSIAGFGLMSAGRTLGRGLLRPIMEGANFEKGMSKVGALTGTKRGTAGFNKLENEALNLGSSTAFSASEVTDGMGYLAMAGFKPQAIKDAMGGVLNLSLAADLDLGETADISSDIMSAFGLEAKDMGRIGDVLVSAFTSSNMSLTQLGETMQYVGPVARAAGMSLEETAAMAGLLGNVGIKGSKAGTALRSMVGNLAAPAKRGRKMLKKLGIQALDSAGNLRPMTQLLGEVAEKTKDLGTGDQLAAFKDLVGKEAMAGFAELINQSGSQGILDYLLEISDNAGKAKEVAEQMSDNLAGDWAKFGSVVEALSITFTKSLNPVLRETVQWFTDIGASLNNWMEQNPKITKVIGVFGGALASVMFVGGGAMIAMGGLAAAIALTNWSAGVLGASRLGTAFGFAARGVLWLGRAMLLNPIGLFVTAVLGAGYLIYEYWEPIKTFFSELWNDPKKKWTEFTDWAGGLLGSLANNWLTDWDGFKSNFDAGNWGSSIVDAWKMVFKWSPLGLVAKGFNELSKWLFDFDLSGPANAIVDSLKAPFDAMFKWFGVKFSALFGWFTNLDARKTDIREFVAGAGAESKSSGAVIQKNINSDGQYTKALTPGGFVLKPSGFSNGGWINGPGTSRSDSIPAWLSKDEHITNAFAANNNRGLLKGINSGKITQSSIGRTIAAAAIATSVIATPAAASGANGAKTIVISPTITINAAPGMDANEIAHMVTQQINDLVNDNHSNLFD